MRKERARWGDRLPSQGELYERKWAEIVAMLCFVGFACFGFDRTQRVVEKDRDVVGALVSRDRLRVEIENARERRDREAETDAAIFQSPT